MSNLLLQKRILLGITGGIAAYKSADLTRRLKEAGADVRVVMTNAAKEFITPLTMQAVSGNPIHYDLLDTDAEAAMGHIELARWADLILIAPASADFMARLAQGRGDDLLTTLCLACKSPIAIAPAMNQQMWKSQATQDNLKLLTKQNRVIFGPAEGEQACGDVGPGRMLEPTEITKLTANLFNTGLLAGKKIVLTAGPTREAIDPVRYISNHSSGKMGYALAQAAKEAGASVVLISGPVNINKIENIETHYVTSAQEMHDTVHNNIIDADIFIAVAAVADYRPEFYQEQKIKKQNNNELVIRLTKNSDIIASVSEQYPNIFTVGFAAESENLISYAKDKLNNKNLNMIIANDISQNDSGFDHDENQITIITENKQLELAKQSKTKCAREIIKFVSREIQYS